MHTSPPTQDSSDHVRQKTALVLIKFLERLFKTLPQFATFAKKVEFIEALVATLMSPSLRGGVYFSCQIRVISVKAST